MKYYKWSTSAWGEKYGPNISFYSTNPNDPRWDFLEHRNKDGYPHKAILGPSGGIRGTYYPWDKSGFEWEPLPGLRVQGFSDVFVIDPNGPHEYNYQNWGGSFSSGEIRTEKPDDLYYVSKSSNRGGLGKVHFVTNIE
jgi:hypothetical protein